MRVLLMYSYVTQNGQNKVQYNTFIMTRYTVALAKQTNMCSLSFKY